MLIYLQRRLGRALVVVLGITVVTFVLTHLIFNPVNLLLPITADASERATLAHSLGLDRSIVAQFGEFIAKLARGDFGTSLWLHTANLPLIMSHLPASLLLAGCTTVVSVFFGMGIGLIAGTRPGTLLDRVVSGLGSIGLSVPDFWLGIILILIFAARLRVLPTGGIGGLSSIVLPTATLSLRPTGRLASVARGSVRAEMSKPYIVAARARGLTTGQILRWHVLKNVAIPCMMLIGYDFLSIFTGYAVAVEVVFQWTGVGWLAVEAVLHQDVTLVSAIVIVTGTLMAVGNTVLDMLSAIVDHRARA